MPGTLLVAGPRPACAGATRWSRAMPVASPGMDVVPAVPPAAADTADRRRRRPARPGALALAAGVFVVVLVVHARSPVTTVTDSVWVVPTALSLLDEHDADLDEYPDAIAALHGWQVATAPDGRRFYQVPVGTALVALP